MNKTRSLRICVLIRWRALGVVFLLLQAPSWAQGPSGMSGPNLGPGVIVDLSKGYAYAMNPSGGIDKLDLKEGKVVWTSKAQGTAKPLAIVGDRLISQAESTGPALKIVVLEAGTGAVAKDPASGKEVVGVRNLPAGVRPAVIEYPHSRFAARVRAEGQSAVVMWEHQSRPRRRGLPPSAESKLQPETTKVPKGTPPAQAPARPSGNAFRISLIDGSITDEPAAAVPAAAPPPAAPPTPLLPGIPGTTKILSEDVRYVLVIEPVRRADAPDRKQPWYTWWIYPRNAENANDRVAEFKTSFSAPASFLLTDSRIIFRTAPYKTGSPNAPAKVELRAIDYQTGKELWDHPIRDTTDRSPPPP